MNIESVFTKYAGNTKCQKCHGEGNYMYDENHGKPCEDCCRHEGGWVELKEYYGKDNGKLCCKEGCGTVK